MRSSVKCFEYQYSTKALYKRTPLFAIYQQYLLLVIDGLPTHSGTRRIFRKLTKLKLAIELKSQ